MMPVDFANNKITGSIIYEDTHSNQLVLNMFNSNTEKDNFDKVHYYP